jgi:hypothetical protein
VSITVRVTTLFSVLIMNFIVFCSVCVIAKDSVPVVELAGYSHINPHGFHPYIPPHPVKRAKQTDNYFLDPESDFIVRLAFGKTFGTCTNLDYSTVEIAKRGSKYETMTAVGPAFMELQMALLASHVFYRAGKVERLKRLNFDNGYEFGWMPKSRLTLASDILGIKTYMESGAGIGYVSETYRNSGSRWNWSLAAGFGMEKLFPGRTLMTVGLQWRHLSNGNMWGKGDELHNSNSGADMIQGSALMIHRF